jgi:hypothetical protein
LKQGDGLALLLLNLAFEYIIRQLNIDANKTLAYKITPIMAYADDISIVSRSLQAAKDTYLEIRTAAKELALEICTNKTKMLIQSHRD